MFISVMAIQLYVATSLWEKCTYDSLKGVCYSVLHAVTDSVRCLLCPSITDKLLTYYHLNHKLPACLVQEWVLVCLCIHFHILKLIQLYAILLHQLCIVIVLHRLFNLNLVL